MTPGPGIEPGTHWWEASALTTAPTLLSSLSINLATSFHWLSTSQVKFNYRTVIISYFSANQTNLFDWPAVSLFRDFLQRTNKLYLLSLFAKSSTCSDGSSLFSLNVCEIRQKASRLL